MQKFEKGDSVRCINNNGRAAHELFVGQVYEVNTVDIRGLLYLVGDSNASWDASRFELVKRASDLSNTPPIADTWTPTGRLRWHRMCAWHTAKLQQLWHCHFPADGQITPSQWRDVPTVEG